LQDGAEFRGRKVRGQTQQVRALGRAADRGVERRATVAATDQQAHAAEQRANFLQNLGEAFQVAQRRRSRRVVDPASRGGLAGDQFIQRKVFGQAPGHVSFLL
jgi:hypothetical protein